MARPKPLEPTKFARVHYTEYEKLHVVSSKPLQPNNPKNKPRIRVYESDYDTLQKMAWQKTARLETKITIADIVRDIVSIYADGKLPVPDAPHNTIPGVIHGLLESLG